MKCIYFSFFLLLVNNIWAMDNHTNQGSTPGNPTSVVSVTKYAYQLLKADNPGRRSDALKFLFQYKIEDIERMKVIRSENEGLVYYGEFRRCQKTSDMFDIFKAGTFVYDDEEIPYHPGPRLILGRTIIPTIQEYAEMQWPASLLGDFPDKQTADAFTRGIKEAEEKLRK